MSRLPISNYALLSDCHSAALVSRAGTVDWLCWPRFDSPAVFGRLLDDTAGHWSIHPVGHATTSRRYRDGALVLETQFETDTGAVAVIDALATGAHDEGHELGAGSPHALLRVVRGVRGAVEMEVEYAPRPEYGIVQPLLVQHGGALVGHGGAAVLHLWSPLQWTVEQGSARARVVVHAHDEIAFALQYQSSSSPTTTPWSPADIRARPNAATDAELVSLVQSLPAGSTQRELAFETLIARYRAIVRAIGEGRSPGDVLRAIVT